jgi:hypothetical protein
MVVIEHKVRGHIESVLEHIRYSGSRIRDWRLEGETLSATLIFEGKLRHWQTAKGRAGSFGIKIEDEHRYSISRSYKPTHVHEDEVRQCLKCWHIWRPDEYLRKSGEMRLRCPKCNSNQTEDTRLIVTKIQRREDLLMLTDGQYPEKFCPRTSLEETSGVVVGKVGKAKLSIGRGFERPDEGHKALLTTRNGFQVDTSFRERQSMKGAVAWCPSNARVFIGGLGLGLILLYLAKSGKAREVIVCEKDKDVIKLVEPRLRRWFSKYYPNFNWKVIHGDALEEVLKGEPYDWIFMDLWKSAYDIEQMKKAEEIAKKNLTPKGRVTCWMKSTCEKQRKT